MGRMAYAEKKATHPKLPTFQSVGNCVCLPEQSFQRAIAWCGCRIRADLLVVHRNTCKRAIPFPPSIGSGVFQYHDLTSQNGLNQQNPISTNPQNQEPPVSPIQATESQKYQRVPTILNLRNQSLIQPMNQVNPKAYNQMLNPMRTVKNPILTPP